MATINHLNLVHSKTEDYEKAKETLNLCLELNLKEILVLGFNEDNHFFCSSNTKDKGMLLYLIEAFRASLMSGDIDRDTENVD